MTKPRIHTPAEIAEAARRRREGGSAQPTVIAAPEPVPAAPASLEQRIASHLHSAIDQQVRGGFSAIGAQSGLAVVELSGTGEPVIVLSVEDVARIAAQVAEGQSPPA